MSARDGSPDPDWGTDWNRTIKNMPLPAYLDWRKAGRPGFDPMDNLRLQAWVRSWKTARTEKLIVKEMGR